MGLVVHVELEETVGELLEYYQSHVFWDLGIYFLGETAAVVVEGVFATDEHSCGRVLL